MNWSTLPITLSGIFYSDGVDVAVSRINTGMYFHSMVPLASLFGLVHFRVALTFFVLGRTGSRDDGGIHDRPATHHQAGFLKPGFYVGKDLFADTVFFDQVAEVEEGRDVRHLFREEVKVHEMHMAWLS